MLLVALCLFLLFLLRLWYCWTLFYPVRRVLFPSLYLSMLLYFVFKKIEKKVFIYIYIYLLTIKRDLSIKINLSTSSSSKGNNIRQNPSHKEEKHENKPTKSHKTTPKTQGSKLYNNYQEIREKISQTKEHQTPTEDEQNMFANYSLQNDAIKIILQCFQWLKCMDHQ